MSSTKGGLVWSWSVVQSLSSRLTQLPDDKDMVYSLLLPLLASILFHSAVAQSHGACDDTLYTGYDACNSAGLLLSNAGPVCAPGSSFSTDDTCAVLISKMQTAYATCTKQAVQAGPLCTNTPAFCRGNLTNWLKFVPTTATEIVGLVQSCTNVNSSRLDCEYALEGAREVNVEIYYVVSTTVEACCAKDCGELLSPKRHKTGHHGQIKSKAF
jgi:hypothetical protein